MNKAMKKYFHPLTPKEYAEKEFIPSLTEEEKLEIKIEKLQQKLTALREKQHWIKQILEPMANRIGELIGRPVVDVSGTMGICARVHIDFYKTKADLKRSKERRGSYKRRPYKTLNVEPVNLREGKFDVRDFSKKPDLKKHPYDSIASINGMCYPTVDITDMPIKDVCKLVY